MAFDLGAIAREISAAPLVSPYPEDLAAAILCDVFRDAGLPPIPDAECRGWDVPGPWRDQLGMLAHILATTSLRRESVAALGPAAKPGAIVARLRASIEPLTAEMIRSNAFRQEELLRKWIACVGGSVEGETPEQSARRLDALDFGKAMKEYARAEKERKAATARREKLIQEALQREAVARGWRE